jgi:UPF0755 protein
VTRSEGDSVVDDDAHSLLFGHDDESGDHWPGDVPLTRSERRRAAVNRKRKKRRGRRSLLVLTVVLLAVIGLVFWFVARPAYNNRYHPKDYTGSGVGTVLVKVNDNDTAANIGHTLVQDGVVASQRAFRNAADDNSKSAQIEPGVYQLRKHMSAKSALAELLNPATHLTETIVVPEGATSMQVVASLATALHTTPAKVQAALSHPAALGLPSTYSTGTTSPSSVEGFLYPATYSFDPGTDPSDALSTMVSRFIDQDRTMGFATDAAKLTLTPYQALVIASIAQAEAKFPADMGKVARVILNRLTSKMPLQIDATSAYGAKLLGLDPTKIIFAQLDSPYNSYLHPGLPPTPISNPGADALTGAAAPPAGNWLYYVNSDAQGHLLFTNSATVFATAAAKCKANHWGCG